MLLELIGVLDTAAVRAPGVPSNSRKTLTVPLGTSLTLSVTVLDSSGTLVPLEANSLTWTVKKSPRDSGSAFAKVGPSVTAATCDFQMVPNDTKQLTPGLYVYDVWYTSPTGQRNAVVPLSPFELEYVSTLPA